METLQPGGRTRTGGDSPGFGTASGRPFLPRRDPDRVDFPDLAKKTDSKATTATPAASAIASQHLLCFTLFLFRLVHQSRTLDYGSPGDFAIGANSDEQ